MSSMRIPAPRLGITAKLLFWSLALILIFYLTTTYLLVRTGRIVAASSTIAGTHYDIGVSTQRMIQTLLTLEENRKRYEILQKDIYMENVIQDLAEFGRQLNEVLERHPEYAEKWEPLTREYTITLSKGGDPETRLLPDQTVNTWIEVLQATRQENQQEMKERLNGLYAQAREASRMGLVGLIASLTLGVVGTLVITWRLNRSLREVRRGIRQWGRAGAVEPVMVSTRDELGELARTFNRMTDQLRREEQMRSDFISMLSHEIRTPLTSIRESVDMVADGTFGEVNERQQRFLDIARQETVRLSGLLERLMQVSRLESSRPEVRPEPAGAAELARSALERIRPAAEAKGVTLDCRVGDGSILVMADREHVQQVLLNLLGNAVKFSGRDTRVELDVLAEPGTEEAVFRVSDQGPGIPEEEQPHVFGKYYREPGLSGTVDGAGLGLFISRAIVEAHGGSMWLASSPGKGSRFSFSLPLVKRGPSAKPEEEA